MFVMIRNNSLQKTYRSCLTLGKTTFSGVGSLWIIML
uniref:Uncharacterized protein n=1 Tax=Arundo donax TaxID=35708 RepID=A0A0A8YBX6_ARUDO